MQNIFKRRERKYLITKEQGAALQRLITRYAEIDRQGEYLIQDLYYDTDNWDIICKAIEKPLFREKLRLRFYGQYNCECPVFLEIKRKFKGTVYKRRIAFPLSNLKNCGVMDIVSAFDSQIAREICYFLQVNQVSEKIHIAYKRTAFIGVEDKGLRITFDRNIVFHLCSFNNNYFFYEHNPDNYNGCQILNDNQVLMEIKTEGAIPLWLTRALGENNIFPVSFSKFGVSYVNHISEWQEVKEVRNAA